MSDNRLKTVKRHIILTIEDHAAPLQFTNTDQEEIAELIEHELQKRYDVTVVDITITNVMP
jgi:hypothetical protein